MSKNELKNAGHVMGYIGATILFVRFIPLLYDQFANPREINLYFLYLEFYIFLLYVALYRHNQTFLFLK